MSLSPTDPYWSWPLAQLCEQLQLAGQNPEKGLSSAEAAVRLNQFGPNSLAGRAGGRFGSSEWGLLLRQFNSPIILILLAAALLSFALDSPIDGLIILVIVLLSGLLGFWQERGAARAAAREVGTERPRGNPCGGAATARCALNRRRGPGAGVPPWRRGGHGPPRSGGPHRARRESCLQARVGRRRRAPPGCG